MQIKRFRAKLIKANCYLVAENGRGIVIDPSVDYDEATDGGAITLLGVFITHGHFDHIAALDSYVKKTAAAVYLHRAAYPKLGNPELNCSALFPFEIKVAVPEERARFIGDGSEIDLLSTPVRVIETPGHSDCSVCFMIADMLFTGDTLFKDGIGRADLPGSVPNALVDSFSKLRSLNPTLTVYPGHGEATSLGREIAGNLYIPR